MSSSKQAKRHPKLNPVDEAMMRLLEVAFDYPSNEDSLSTYDKWEHRLLEQVNLVRQNFVLKT